MKMNDELQYESISAMTIWASSTDDSISRVALTFLNEDAREENVKEESIERILYYIDATNSFPIANFQRLVSPLDKNKQTKIFDNIRIITCLDFNELSITVNKIMPSILNPKRRVQLLLVINGVGIMFQNSQYQDVNKAYSQLNSTFLKLRIIANNNKPKDRTLRTVIIAPVNYHRHINKKQKRSSMSSPAGKSVCEYIGQYYADSVI